GVEAAQILADADSGPLGRADSTGPLDLAAQCHAVIDAAQIVSPHAELQLEVAEALLAGQSADAGGGTAAKHGVANELALLPCPGLGVPFPAVEALAVEERPEGGVGRRLGQLPQPHCPVLADRGGAAAVRGEGDGGALFLVAAEAGDLLAGGHVP